ncbi:MAG TPA: hypothetical protein VMV40_00580 [Acidiferrobacter sp.]|nr:hypothetical protein [Acidiferrobacter sp.]
MKAIIQHTLGGRLLICVLRNIMTKVVVINTVRAWLGHVSLNTAHIYAEMDLKGKAKALAKCDISSDQKTGKRWAKHPGLMSVLRAL